ncbi:MAG: hypothetical protein RIR16_708 [Actinomycetota bacterium]|jgi:DNA polymerase-3 subunit delta'
MTNLELAPIWDSLPGQAEAIEQVAIAVKHRDEGVHHAWLMTGPPGSGRSNLARLFASALVCEFGGCGSCKSCNLAANGGHPDISILATEKVQISIDEIRQVVSNSQFGGSMSRFRIVIIEDADRMTERSSNVLLKALEEPPAGTIWILCAPSEADMLPTIRSRVRRVGLKVPSVAAVTQILEAEGVDPKLARACAEEAQCHIGMARRLATSSEARSRRRETLMVALAIDSVTSAVNAAQRWLEIAKKDADALTEERDSQEKAELLKSLGLAEGDSIPPALRVDLKNLEENQKRRSTRSLRDGIDRILVDLLSVYRDVLNIQLMADVPLVNSALRFSIDELAESTKPEQTISKLEKIAETRHYIDSNVRDLLALEGLAVALIGPKK